MHKNERKQINKQTSKQEKHGRLQTVTISSKGAFSSNKYEHVND